MPNRDTPPRLVEAWLDFHRGGLCRNLDAVFAFYSHGMEIWCRSEENSSYRKLLKIIEPLRNSHAVELYHTRLPKNSGENSRITWTAIPPSIAENRELSTSMRPVAFGGPPRAIFVEDADGNMQLRIVPGSSSADNNASSTRIMRSRLVAWANSVLRNSRIMRQFAADIPELLSTAFEPAFGTATHKRARDVCRAHAKDMVKIIRELNKNLSRAFPKPSTKTPKKKNAAKKEPSEAFSVVMERADRIAAEARALSGQVYRFIYPSQQTVDLDELQRPGLLASLDALENETRDFEQALTRLTLIS